MIVVARPVGLGAVLVQENNGEVEPFATPAGAVAVQKGGAARPKRKRWH